MPKVKYTKAKGLFQESGNVEQMALLGTAGSIAAAGSSQSDATEITTIVAIVSGADATKGVILPEGVDGAIHVVVNTAAAALKIYPASGEKIEGGSANAAVTTGNNEVGMYIYTGATRGWQSIVSA